MNDTNTVSERGYPSWTITGTPFYAHDPRPEEVHLIDVASGCATAKRFLGCALRDLSVAQHSILCSYLVPREDARAAFLHDAAEAYIADMPSPQKRSFRARGISEFDVVEERLLRTIFTRFNEPYVEAKWKNADRVALYLEAAKVAANPEKYWPEWADEHAAAVEYSRRALDALFRESPLDSWALRDLLTIPDWTRARVENAFLSRAIQLGIE